MEDKETQPKEKILKIERQKGLSIDNIRGQDHIKNELKQLHMALSNLETYYACGADLPKGILFIGGPGLGKTMAARAITSDAPVSVCIIRVSEVVSVLVDGRAVNLKKMFDEIETQSKVEPVVVIIDELEFMSSDRSKNIMHEGSKSAVNLLLEWMDGVEENSNIVVIGCTNIIKNIDPALLRSGRFDKKLFFNELGAEDIRLIVEDHILEKFTKQGAPIIPEFTSKDYDKLTKGIKTIRDKYYMNGADARLCVSDALKTKTIDAISKFKDLTNIKSAIKTKQFTQLTMEEVIDNIERIAKNNHEVAQSKTTKTFTNTISGLDKPVAKQQAK